MLTVGLTGGIASGKSEVGAVLRRLGCRLFDADRIARRLLEPGTGVFAEVCDLFGEVVLGEEGAIDREALGQLVFNDPDKLRQLNAAVHPAVIAEEDRLISRLAAEAGGRPCIAVVEAALMVEAGTHTRYHRLLVVHCTEEQQIERLAAARGLDRAAALARIRSQLPTVRKLALAHYAVDSSGSIEQTRQRAAEVHRCLVRDERQRREAG